MAFELTADQTETLGAIAKSRKHVKARQAIYLQDEAFSSLFVMVSGASKSVVRLGNGKSAISNISLRGDIVGFTGVASGVMPESQIALQNSVLCVVPYGDLLPRFQAESVIRMQFPKAIARTMLQQQAMHLAVNHATADGKVRGFLRWFMGQLSMRGLYHEDFTLPLSKKDLASFLGVRLETVSRSFSSLARDNIVTTRGRRVHVVNVDALEN